MKKFCIILNNDKDDSFDLAEYIKEFLIQKGCKCKILDNILSEKDGTRHYTDSTQIPENTECAIVLGGDGTMIQAAIDLVDLEIPLLGVNIGTLGFLTEVERQGINDSLEKLIRNEYTIENRIMLEEMRKNNKNESLEISPKNYALNDVVISRGSGFRLITIRVYINGKLADVYRADGLILSTPTGSTGYNLSAGGPVLVPHLHAVVITPICAHSLNKRSLVVDAKDQITLQLGQTKEAQEDVAYVTADGRIIEEIKTGDMVDVAVSNEMTQLIKLSEFDFYKRMRNKLNGN